MGMCYLDEVAVKAIMDMGCIGRLGGTETCPSLTPLEQSIIGYQKAEVSAAKITTDEWLTLQH